MSRLLVASMIMLALVFSASGAYAHSNGQLLNFNQLGDLTPVGNFYNGGGVPTTPNYGITFSSNFMGLKSVLAGGSGEFALDPTKSTAIFVAGNVGTMATGIMNVSNGFSTGIQFFYTAGFSQTVTLWSGANGTGTVLATISLAANNGNCQSSLTYCNWSSIGVNFSGTAKSMTVTGPADGMGISDITLGASTTAVPEPSTLFLLGTGLVGASSRKLRRIWNR
jgi:PEP-CTERM motif